MAAVRHPATFSIHVDEDVHVDEARGPGGPGSGVGAPSVIRVEGELDSLSAGELRDGFGRTVGRPSVIIDIRQVPFVDSAGLGALVGGVRRLREAGGTVALCCTASSVLRLLAVTGFDRMIPVTATPAEAMELIATAQLAGTGR